MTAEFPQRDRLLQLGAQLVRIATADLFPALRRSRPIAPGDGEMRVFGGNPEIGPEPGTGGSEQRLGFVEPAQLAQRRPGQRIADRFEWKCGPQGLATAYC